MIIKPFVYTCPYCGDRQIDYETTFAHIDEDVVSRSDQYANASPFCDSVVYRCTKCNRCYIQSEASGDESSCVSADSSNEHKPVTGFNKLSLALAQFKIEGKQLEGKEFAIRLRMLWRSNDEDSLVPSSMADLNRRRMLELPETSNYLRAEILRELGDFSAAQVALGEVRLGDQWYPAVPLMERAIAVSSKSVFKLFTFIPPC